MSIPGAMTLPALVARCQALAELGGYANAGAPPDWEAQINAAYAEFTWDGETHIDSLNLATTTVADTATYTLGAVGTDRSWKVINEVWVGDYLVERSSESAVRAGNRNWLRASSGTPSVWWRISTNVIRLYPAPSTSALTITVRGVRSPVALTGTAYPDIPEVYHSKLADRAYLEEAMRYARGEERQALSDKIVRWKAAVQALKGRAGIEASYGAQMTRPQVASSRVSP